MTTNSRDAPEVNVPVGGEKSLWDKLYGPELTCVDGVEEVKFPSETLRVREPAVR